MSYDQDKKVEEKLGMMARVMFEMEANGEFAGSGEYSKEEWFVELLRREYNGLKRMFEEEDKKPISKVKERKSFITEETVIDIDEAGFKKNAEDLLRNWNK